ncbi:hypothetical protein B296_00014305 [Ensete ventricosum]|uniref:cytokinin riboside 5'-monophosphate phosphoribohydrolase n=1 Tax=Ensete ventricosum TaxID=4639 RepID=A0A426ZKA1_ENSVE|nr:hypothetical protein B296_00014305 [Ensete ventricosum]
MEENKVGRPSRFRRVCVFCGSSPGKRNCYQDAAVELGEELVSNSIPGAPFLILDHWRNNWRARFTACICATGGYGTLEELLEVITWAQLGIHSKPVGLLNVDGYYNSLLAFIDKAVDDGFIQPIQRRLVVSASNAGDLVQKLEVTAALLFTYLPYWPPSLSLYAIDSTPNTDWSCRNTSQCRTTWLRRFAGRWSRCLHEPCS